MPPFLQTALENLLSPMVLFFGLVFLRRACEVGP